MSQIWVETPRGSPSKSAIYIFSHMHTYPRIRPPAKSMCTCMRKPSSGFEHSLCHPAPDGLIERPRLPDQSFKSIYKCTKSQMQTGWHMVTLFKCFSMCLWCQHLFHTPLHLKEGGEKKDVSVTFSRCQVWKEKEGIKREREKGDLRDLSAYGLHNLFICLEEIDRGCSLSGTYWQLHKYLHNFTHGSLTTHLKISEGQFKVSTFKEKWEGGGGLNGCKIMLSFTTGHYSRCVANLVIAWALWTFD